MSVTTKAGVPITDPRLVELSYECMPAKQAVRRRAPKHNPRSLPWQQRRAIYLVNSGAVQTFKAAMLLVDNPVHPNTATEGSRGSGVRP